MLWGLQGSFLKNKHTRRSIPFLRTLQGSVAPFSCPRREKNSDRKEVKIMSLFELGIVVAGSSGLLADCVQCECENIEGKLSGQECSKPASNDCDDCEEEDE